MFSYNSPEVSPKKYKYSVIKPYKFKYFVTFCQINCLVVLCRYEYIFAFTKP